MILPSFRKIYPAVFGFVLTAFTAYAVLDTFVLTRSYRTAEINDSFVFINPETEVTQISDDITINTEITYVSEQVTPVFSDLPETAAVSSSAVSGSQTRASSSETSASSGRSHSSARPVIINGDYEEDEEEHEYVLSSAESSVQTNTEPPEETRPPETEAPPPEPVPENDGRLYSDENIKIGIKQYREYDTDIYVADVMVSSLEFLKTAFAHNTYGRNVKAHTSDIAKEFDAIFAVNGDYYGAREHGYVVRNGVLYRDEASSTREALMIKADSSFEVVKESETTAQALVDAGAYQVLSFGPGLVKDYDISVSENDEVAIASESNPRTAIGFIDFNHFIFVVSDGRTQESQGLSLYELAGFMRDHGAKTAYNLDGGGSSSMYFLGEVVNVPTTDGNTIKERSVSDIVYIGY